MRRGEIWWANPWLAGGSSKRRPFLVVSADTFNRNEEYPKVLAVHLTTVVRTGGPYSWEVHLDRGIAGIPKASVVKCNEIYTLFKADLIGLAGTLSPSRMSNVDTALAVSPGLGSFTSNLV